MNFVLKLILIFIVISSLFKGSDLFSQSTEYKFNEFQTEEENYPKLIRSVIKDRKGFIWFGTGFGLFRFDGYNFKSYFSVGNDSNSLSSNDILSICDDGNYLWIGTSNGLSRLDKATDKFKTYKSNSADQSSQDNENVLAVCNSSSKGLFVGTAKD